jgi:hypothetical protein
LGPLDVVVKVSGDQLNFVAPPDTPEAITELMSLCGSNESDKRPIAKKVVSILESIRLPDDKLHSEIPKAKK